MPKLNRIALILLTAIALLFLGGCAETIAVRVVNQNTEKPVAGALVERVRPVSLLGKITNPVGAFYHPDRTAESRWTDSNGVCFLKKLRPEDVCRLHVMTIEPVTFTLGTRTFALSPGTNGLRGTSCVYSVKQLNGGWQTSAYLPSRDWEKERPSTRP